MHLDTIIGYIVDCLINNAICSPFISLPCPSIQSNGTVLKRSPLAEEGDVLSPIGLPLILMEMRDPEEEKHIHICTERVYSVNNTNTLTCNACMRLWKRTRPIG